MENTNCLSVLILRQQKSPVNLTVIVRESFLTAVSVEYLGGKCYLDNKLIFLDNNNNNDSNNKESIGYPD